MRAPIRSGAMFGQMAGHYPPPGRQRTGNESGPRKSIVGSELDAGKSVEQVREGDTELLPREGRTEAVVHAVPERHVMVVVTRDVEHVGVREPGRA